MTLPPREFWTSFPADRCRLRTNISNKRRRYNVALQGIPSEANDDSQPTSWVAICARHPAAADFAGGARVGHRNRGAGPADAGAVAAAGAGDRVAGSRAG